LENQGEILADKMEFFSRKVGFLRGKVGFFPEMLANLYKFDLGFSWVFLLAHLGFLFFRVATLIQINSQSLI